MMGSCGRLVRTGAKQPPLPYLSPQVPPSRGPVQSRSTVPTPCHPPGTTDTCPPCGTPHLHVAPVACHFLVQAIPGPTGGRRTSGSWTNGRWSCWSSSRGQARSSRRPAHPTQRVGGWGCCRCCCCCCVGRVAAPLPHGLWSGSSSLTSWLCLQLRASSERSGPTYLGCMQLACVWSGLA